MLVWRNCLQKLSEWHDGQCNGQTSGIKLMLKYEEKWPEPMTLSKFRLLWSICGTDGDLAFFCGFYFVIHVVWLMLGCFLLPPQFSWVWECG